MFLPELALNGFQVFGVFTCDEWKRYATRLFNEADRNHDGYLNEEEFKAIRKAAAIRPSPELRDEAIACMALADLRVASEWEGFPPGSCGLAFDARLERYSVGDAKGEPVIEGGYGVSDGPAAEAEAEAEAAADELGATTRSSFRRPSKCIEGHGSYTHTMNAQHPRKRTQTQRQCSKSRGEMPMAP